MVKTKDNIPEEQRQKRYEASPRGSTACTGNEERGKQSGEDNAEGYVREDY